MSMYILKLMHVWKGIMEETTAINYKINNPNIRTDYAQRASTNSEKLYICDVVEKKCLKMPSSIV